MSDVLANASRYNTSNSSRIDGAGKNTGGVRSSDGIKIRFDCSGLVYHVLRESGYNVPYDSSSVMADAKTFKGDWATPVTDPYSVTPGTLVYFNGHVGIVRTFDPATGRGTFLSMTGKNSDGIVKPDESFTTNDSDVGQMWGANKSFKGFAAVKPELYDPDLDQHANGANPDYPVFNIPEHKSVGFITLPDNGGFPKSSAARDLSSEPTVVASSPFATTTPPTNLYDVNSTSAFAETLAHLESRGEPFDGYRAVNKSGGGIGAIGRYGFREPSLQAIGWVDANGDWTNAAKAQGVKGIESFLDNPHAQEVARVAYMQTLKNELKANGAWSMVGDTVEGHQVTEAGLIAAAWKEGSGNVLKVFNGQSTRASLDHNVFFRMDEFGVISENADVAGGRLSSSVATPTGHWEDTTQWDEMGNVIQSGPRVWVPDDTQTISPTTGAGAGRGKFNPPSVESGSEPSTVQSNNPTATHISPDGTTAALPNGQVIHAGPGGKLDIGVDGILTVSRPAQGWANADGSAADIRQITTYEASGEQIGTSIAQQLPGEAAAIENYSQRTLHLPQADGSTAEVQTHFQAGVGWVDDSGLLMLSLKDAQAQYDAKAVNPISGASAENDYLPSGPKGQDQAIPQTVKPADPDPHVQSGQGGDFSSALLDAFSKPSPSAELGPATQLASLDTGTVSDAGNGFADPATTGNPVAENSSKNFSIHLQSKGDALNADQRTALAGQIDSLNLGDKQGLSYYTPPDGSALIANADGDVVGQIGAPKNGEVSLRANAISVDGNATTQESYIDTSGNTTSYSPYQLSQVNAGMSLVQGFSRSVLEKEIDLRIAA